MAESSVSELATGSGLKTRCSTPNEFFVSRTCANTSDMKYWIWLRDPEASPFPAETEALRGALRHGVKTGRLFCPMSYPAFTELMRINPQMLRLRQAETMDELSVGVAIRNGFDIAEIE